MPAAITTVLFDADGVVQRTSPGWLNRIYERVGVTESERQQEFLGALFPAEQPALIGRVDVAVALADVLKEWRSEVEVEDLLLLWNEIEVDVAVLAEVRRLLAAGIRVGLATNQQARRAAYMQETLGYAEVFSDHFYSCELGVAKPDPAYFRAILNRLGEGVPQPAETVLFLDDNAGNVDGARSVGIRAELFPQHGGLAALTAILERYDLSPA